MSTQAASQQVAIGNSREAAPSITPEQTVEEILNKSLFGPVREFFTRPSQMVRARLVAAGYHLAGDFQDRSFLDEETLSRCDRLAEVLESIHAGSLIVDDIQDCSKERRGRACLHEIYGVPVALNVGNWLYFQPFDWIRQLGFEPAVELRIYRLCHEAMIKAHVGQAVDVGTRIIEVDRASVRTLCMTSLRLKTGSLTSLALALGAALGGASDKRLEAIAEFGLNFGVALQMFDDIGNFSLPPDHPKRLEDFRLGRPTWIWAVAADQCTDAEYGKFLKATRALPNEALLQRWLNKKDLVNQARKEAREYLDRSFDSISAHLCGLDGHPRAVAILSELSERIRTSYG